jgi:hypothetical protein
MNGAVPPVTETAAVPSHPMLQETLVWDKLVTANVLGITGTTIVVVVVPHGELTATVYVPAHNEVAVAPVPPEGDHE